MARIGSQPVALAGIALVLILIGAGSIAAWRVSTGATPETERAISARQIQLRTTEASEQLVEKTKALEVSQQESIDQLQALQEQMQGVRRLLAAQQNDAKRLSDQVGAVAGAIDSLRQSFASTQSSEAADAPQAKRTIARPKGHATKVHATKGTRTKRPKT